MLRRFALCLTMLCLFIFAGCSHNGTGIDHNSSVVNTTEDVTLTFIYGEENVSVTLDEDKSEKVIDILNGNRYHSTFSGVPSCGFDENISLTVGSQIFAVARDTCHCMQDLGNLRYFDLSQEDMSYIHSLFEKYGGYFPCV